MGHRICSIIICLLLFAGLAARAEDTSNVAQVMAGISNDGKNKDKPYVAAGDRTYIIGTQDGNFPDLGRHVEGEMGGLWLHPIKLLDGYWARLTDMSSGSEY